MQRFFLFIFLHIMTRFYLKVQMKSLKDFKCVWIIPNVDIKKGTNSHFFGEITIKASPPIYILEGKIRYAGLLLAPAKSFGLQPRPFWPSANPCFAFDHGLVWPSAKALSLSLYQESKSIPWVQVNTMITITYYKV